VKTRVLSVTTAVVLLAGCFGGRAAAIYTAQDETAPAQPQQWSFDSDPDGELPAGATVFSGSWAVRPEADAPSQPNALCQTATAEFPALSLASTIYADVVLSARFKPISGRTDQAAGLIFRVQDMGNYYILRANALEGNVNFYKYAGGRRSGLKESKVVVPSGQWQELRVEVVGNRFRGFVDGQQVVEATDHSYHAGQIGLWTKADSVTCFDDVAAQLPETPPEEDTGLMHGGDTL
jgi:hypothetical protein